MTFDVCVIGGGASGLSAAIAASREGASVVVLERLDKAGKKLLVTGNGKCNLTNRSVIRSQIPEKRYFCKQKDFPKQILTQFDANDTCQFFQSLAVYTKDKDELVYPLSEQAQVVADALQWELNAHRVPIDTGVIIQKIRPIQRQKEETLFIIQTNKGEYRCHRLIMACGGKSGGSAVKDGESYRLCQQFGHHLIPVVPALCGLHCREKYFKELAGIRIQGHVSLFIDGKKAAEEAGEIQLTAYGISGIPVFQVSRYAAYGILYKKKVTAVLDLLPAFKNADALLTEISGQIKQHPDHSISMLLSGMLPRKLALLLPKICQIDPSKKASRLERNILLQMMTLIKQMPVVITDTNGFDQAQVSAGGVDTTEINTENLSSRIVPGLYIVGELLDVDAICGGYNLQWAWASGILAGTDAGRRSHA